MIRTYSIFILVLLIATFIGKPVLALINEQTVLEANRYLLDIFNQVKDIANHLKRGHIFYLFGFLKNQTGYLQVFF